jgi:predicted acyltransferase (DUF342 family)
MHQSRQKNRPLHLDNNGLQMKLRKPVFAAMSLLAVVSLLAPGVLAVGPDVNSDVASAMDRDVFGQSIFAKTYVTLSATSTVNGDVWAEAATTVGANALVDGSIVTGAATTLGADAEIVGDATSGAAITLGAGSKVDGRVFPGAALTIGAGAVIRDRAYVPRNEPTLQDVVDAQVALNGLAPQVVLLPGNIAADVTYYPGAHQIAGPLSVSAGTTITLDASGNPDATFIFNISGYVTFGADVNVVVANSTSNTRVIWNVTGTYISVGAGANLVGTLMANGYISTGANSTVSSVGNSPGSAFSATSYVTLGAGATMGSPSEALATYSTQPEALAPFSASEVGPKLVGGGYSDTVDTCSSGTEYSF